MRMLPSILDFCQTHSRNIEHWIFLDRKRNFKSIEFFLAEFQEFGWFLSLF